MATLGARPQMPHPWELKPWMVHILAFLIVLFLGTTVIVSHLGS
jgi:hypothetical protein